MSNKETDRVQCETTAARAQVEAPNADVARQVEENAEQAKEAAGKVAQTVSDIDVLKREIVNKTNAVVTEGKVDVDTAKATGTSYLDQAMTTAGNVLASAHDFVRSAGQGNDPHSSAEAGESTQTNGGAGDVLGSLQSTAKSAVGTTQEYLGSMQASVQPQLESLGSQVASAKAAMRPHVEKARETAQGYLGMGTGSVERTISYLYVRQ